MENLTKLTKQQLKEEKASLLKAYENFKAKNLKLDMSRGKPGPEQLDLSMEVLNEKAYIGKTGIDARNYGNLEGMPEAREFFAQMLGLNANEVFAGGNSSLNFMYNMIELGVRQGFLDSPAPWASDEKRKFLCPAPGYDRHFRITEYFGFELVSVPMLSSGPNMDIVEKLVAADSTIKGIWCVPMYSNPDGYTYSDDTVKRLANMQTAAVDFKIFWDNAYCVHHLNDKPDVLLNIMDEAKKCGNENRILEFCSLSKVTFAGAGVGAMGASEANINYILKNAFPMTISYDKLNQLRHVNYFKNMDGVTQHMKKHAQIIKPKFDVVLQTLSEELGEENAMWTNPNGGYFISLFLPNGCAKSTVQLCKEAGVVLTGAGAAYPYSNDENDSNIRIAPTYPPIEELLIATQLLCVCSKIAIIDKLMA